MLQQQLCGGCWLHAIGSTKQVAEHAKDEASSDEADQRKLRSECR